MKISFSRMFKKYYLDMWNFCTKKFNPLWGGRVARDFARENTAVTSIWPTDSNLNYADIQTGLFYQNTPFISPFLISSDSLTWDFDMECLVCWLDKTRKKITSRLQTINKLHVRVDNESSRQQNSLNTFFELHIECL